MESALQLNYRARMKRAGAAVLMTAIAGLGVVLPAQAVLAQEPEVTTLDFWAVRDAQMSGQVALASELGFFEDEGLDVTVKWIVSGTDVPSLAASGDILMTSESVYISAMLQEKGVDMRYMMPLSDVGGSQQVVLGPNTDVSIPSDLEGKSIGMAAGAGVGMAITAMCEEYGVDCSKITLVNLQPPDQIPALVRGDIDAMAIWNPYALEGVKVGGTLYFSGNKSYIDGEEKEVDYMYLDGGLIVNGEFADENPETVKAVMRALVTATEYFNSHSVEETAAILTGTLDIPEEDLQKILAMNIYTNAVDDATVGKATTLLAYGGRPDIAWVNEVYAPEDLYYLDLMKEVAPEMVTAEGF